MKIDDEVKAQMISSEGPILIAKASEFLIEELTLRAWLHADSCRRKTLQKIDIGDATTQSEMFDFLIDIVPRPGQPSTNAPIPIVRRMFFLLSRCLIVYGVENLLRIKQYDVVNAHIQIF